MNRKRIVRIIAGCSCIVLSIAATLIFSLVPGLEYKERLWFIVLVLCVCVPASVVFLVFGIRCYRNVSKISEADPKTAAQQIAAENLEIFDIMQRSKFLSKNEFTRTDTVIFTFFITRSFCITKIKDRNKAYEFSNEYVKAVTDGIRNRFLCFNRGLVSEMFDNRVDFYDSIVMNTDLDDPVEALMFQFENIINHDIRSKRYVPIAEDIPVVLSGFKESMMQQFEVELLYKVITALAQDILNRYEKNFSSWKTDTNPDSGINSNTSQISQGPPHAPPAKKKSKKAMKIIFSIIASILLISIGAGLSYAFFVPKSPATEDIGPIDKDADYLYVWMNEHSKLIDGTILQYSDTDAYGNKYTLCYNTNKVQECRWYIDFNSSEDTPCPTTVLLTLFGGEKSQEVWITSAGSDGSQTRASFYHSPETFTDNSPVEIGDIYYTGSESKLRKIICQERARPNLCLILDWLQNSFCPTANMTMADFGYYSYK